MNAALTFLKAALAAGLVAAVSVAFQVGQNNYRICTNEANCQTFTAEQYTDLKRSLADKVDIGTPLTWDEYNLLISVLDYEVKQDGGAVLTNFDHEPSLEDRLVDKLYE